MEDKFEEIYRKYLDNQVSEEEFEQLLELFTSDDAEICSRREVLFDDTWNSLLTQPGSFNLPRCTVAAQAPVAPIDRATPRRKWWIAAAAAIIIFCAGLTALLITMHNNAAKKIMQPTVAMNDVAPGSHGALLTLADGSRVVLDSTLGHIGQQSGVNITNKDGSVAYQLGGKKSTTTVYNTISTPQGRRYQLMLEDGTKVWLNAASSIRFPAVFTGNERRVEVSGEAYFEVSKNDKQPFIVSVKPIGAGKPVDVKVLGTHFNVHAYSNEAISRTTLLEGSVEITSGESKVKLLPGQQAAVNNNISVMKNVNTDKVMAWKNNRFYFQEDDIRDIMQQLARWYDIDVVFEERITEAFTGSISAEAPLSKVLEMFENVGRIEFSIEGKTVRIRSLKK